MPGYADFSRHLGQADFSPSYRRYQGDIDPDGEPPPPATLARSYALLSASLDSHS